MKVMWLCNIALPKIAYNMGISIPPFGGWLTSLAEDLNTSRGVELCVVFPSSKVVENKVDNLSYYSFSPEENNTSYFESVLERVVPDVVHIWGTEERHAYEMVKACSKKNIKDKVVVSIQGLVSIIERHYYAALPERVVKAWSFHDIVTKRNIYFGRKNFVNRGRLEERILTSVNHVIGRTDWDEACVTRLNQNIKYHFCNETLREHFYEDKWTLEGCQRHSIFVSQCSYPIKGFHLMLEAMAEIIKKYPDAHLYTTGHNPLKLSFRQKVRQTAYSIYIGKLLKKYRLQDKVTFLGVLDAEKMKAQYLKANVFVSCSSIENSPNSVGEAMILGVPTISSDVGGVKNMLVHEKEGFIYPWDEPYMISYYVDRIFRDEKTALYISDNAIKHAELTHNRKKNYQTILNIYKDIAQ